MTTFFPRPLLGRHDQQSFMEVLKAPRTQAVTQAAMQAQPINRPSA
jgi:hypothetical protein